MYVPRWKRLLAHALTGPAPRLAIPSGLRADWMTSDAEMIRDSQEDTLTLRAATVRWYTTMLQKQAQLLAHAGEFRAPLLVLMGDADPVADPVGAHDFYDRAGSPDKQFHLFPQLLHELLRETEREPLFRQILAWMQDRSGGRPSGDLPPSG
jgi:lysophospholipase